MWSTWDVLGKSSNYALGSFLFCHGIPPLFHTFPTPCTRNVQLDEHYWKFPEARAKGDSLIDFWCRQMCGTDVNMLQEQRVVNLYRKNHCCWVVLLVLLSSSSEPVFEILPTIIKREKKLYMEIPKSCFVSSSTVFLSLLLHNCTLFFLGLTHFVYSTLE